jgi:hypothetical protein
MALVLADRVKETTVTTGTGTVTLAGAATGFQSFAVVGNGNTTYYTIAGQGTAEWEVGIGTYTSAGTTLARTTVLASSNAGSLVAFSAGTKDVFVTYPAGRSIYADGTTLTATNSSVLPIASGGSGQTTAQLAMNAFAAAVTSGSYLRGNGTNVVMSTIQAADVPTLNQNTSGNAATATGLTSSNYISAAGSSGNANTDFQNTAAYTYRYQGDAASVTNGPGGSWWFYEDMRHSNASNYWGTQIAWGWEDNANKLATRNVTGGTFGAWVYYINSSNYTSYVTPTAVSDQTNSSTGYFDLPAGTTAQRPGSPNVGMVRYNTTLARYEGYTAAGWQILYAYTTYPVS